jgi:alginate O-acetyltransferase complex protein AlgI
MLFNSIEFLLFLPIVFVLYWFVFNKQLTHQNFLLVIAGYFFYAWWDWRFLLLLIFSTLLDYLYGFGVASKNKRKSKLFLWLSIINNLGILGIFKYYNFFATEFQEAFNLIGIHSNLSLIEVALPVGISFYTFHGMSYVFDIYRGLREPVKNYISYSLFVCFFPLLVAGPIERAGHLLPQIQSRRVFNYNQTIQGCRQILWGMFTKVIIADGIASTVNNIFDHFGSFNAFTLIIGAIGFGFQIYCDFSGYSNIAIGTARLFGFELLSNFKFPYFSRDIAEFWRRWHVSLSSWFRDYLYIPLGGSKKGTLPAIRNIYIIFLVSGFWHGASWNFIVWGGIHATAYLPLFLIKKNRRNIGDIVAFEKKLPGLKELIQIVTTFTIVTIAWVFFRVHDVKNGFVYIEQIVINTFRQPRQYLSIPQGVSIFFYIIPVILVDWYCRRNERNIRIPEMPKIVRWILYLILIVFTLLNIGEKKEFIYFQF